ncbi:hypothetical protein K2Q00_00340 [Patescibacteria group bacterium]|nr:hypothetical protein [Patescibacteria group bacterium]
MTDTHAADQHTGHEGTVSFKDRVLRAVAILGLIALLLLGAWGIIQIAFTLYGFLGNTAPTSPATVTTKTEQMVVTVPGNTQSGTPFTLSFTHLSAQAGQNASGNYAYQFSYSCADGLSVQAPLPTGGTQTVACNTPFNYTGASSQVQLIATLSGSAPVTTTFTVAAKNLATGAITANANANTTVKPMQKAATPAVSKPSTSKPGTTYVPAKTTARTLYGSPDLAVTMGSITNSGGLYSAQFTVQNVGTNVAPYGWTFNAALPTSPVYTYPSNPQQALNPGDKIVYTLSFTKGQAVYSYGASYGYGNTSYQYPSNCGYTANYTYNGVYNYPGASYTCNMNNYYNGYNYGTSYVTVTVDPNNYVYESSEANNSATATVY